MPDPARGVAAARAALAGNPSDGYGGAVLAVTIDGLGAAVSIPGDPHAPPAPLELIDAAVARFARECAPAATGDTAGWSTTIPRSVGLGGSSAIVIATLRALCARHGVHIDRDRLAALALAIEVEDLGIAAGPQDRIVQSYGGLTFMDFAAGRSVMLDRGRLPPLLIAWRESSAAHSGIVHDDLRERHTRGERRVLAGIAALSRTAHDARRAIDLADHDALRAAVDASFDARAAMLELDPAHVEMIEAARAAGGAANYAGSGGAIVCACRNEDERRAVREALARIGCGVLDQDP